MFHAICIVCTSKVKTVLFQFGHSAMKSDKKLILTFINWFKLIKKCRNIMYILVLIPELEFKNISVRASIFTTLKLLARVVSKRGEKRK